MVTETAYGNLTLIEDGKGFYVKAENSWVWPIFSTVSYPSKQPEPLTEEIALETIRRAVQDSEMVYEALHKKPWIPPQNEL